MSEWNKISGNWSFEERDFSKWGKERYKEILQAEETVNKTGYKGTYKVTKIDGDVFCIVSHGQLKYIANFDELKIKFTHANFAANNCSGHKLAFRRNLCYNIYRKKERRKQLENRIQNSRRTNLPRGC